MGWFSNLFGGGSPEEKAAKAAAKAARREAELVTLLDRASGKDPENASKDARRGAARDLLLASEPMRAIEGYEAIARDFPDEQAECLNQIGVCHHVAKDYAAAIRSYEAAKALGLEDSTLDENLAEARSQFARQ